MAACLGMVQTLVRCPVSPVYTASVTALLQDLYGNRGGCYLIAFSPATKGRGALRAWENDKALVGREHCYGLGRAGIQVLCSRTVNRLPHPILLSTVTLPPMASVISFTSANPNPAPPRSRVRLLSLR